MNIRMRLLPNGPAVRHIPPGVDQIAALMPGDGTEFTEPHEIYIRHRYPPRIQNVSIFHGAYDPLVYVLIYPYGDYGYQLPEASRQQDELTMMAFYRYKLFERPSNSFLFKMRKLFEQYIVDIYCKIEMQRLLFIKRKQEQFRRDFITDPDRVLLPSSFVGGPRYMKQNYQDCMAIVRHFGKPDLFITMTCNKDWEEITNSLETGQTVFDRPDVVARVLSIFFIYRCSVSNLKLSFTK
jgi:hypothetical protein